TGIHHETGCLRVQENSRPARRAVSVRPVALPWGVLHQPLPAAVKRQGRRGQEGRGAGPPSRGESRHPVPPFGAPGFRGGGYHLSPFLGRRYNGEARGTTRGTAGWPPGAPARGGTSQRFFGGWIVRRGRSSEGGGAE